MTLSFSKYTWGLRFFIFAVTVFCFQLDNASAQTCDYSNWVQGKYYVKGDIVKFTDGKLYVAKYANPGYTPTISTWYWAQYACTASTMPSTTTSPSTSSCSYPNWVQGKYYAKGDIVKYTDGLLYIALNANPGYNPVVSTWYWGKYVCTSTSTTTTSTSTTGFMLTEAQFNQMFPDRSAFYTYSGLVAATKAYPAIFNTGSETVKRQELAAFLANVDHETGGLQYVREINTANYNSYCASSSQHPCASGQQYYGRGPLQLSWNYNYGAAGAALGLNLLADPDLVARDATVAWKTAMWFWMTQTGAGKMTAHNAMVNQAGFGETIRTINGALECNKASGTTGNTQMQMRVKYYYDFTGLFGVTAGNNVGC